MRFFLALALIVLAAMAQAQTGTQDHSDLIVLEFSSGNYKTGGGMIRSVQDPDPPKNEPIRINQTVRNEPQEVINRREMQEHRADMRNAEINASLSTNRSAPIYFYRLLVKNASTKVVKGFAWEYQPFNAPDQLARQFFCYIKAKPNEKRKIELYSPLAPTRVIDASKTREKSARGSDGEIIINKIEYVDGTVWLRSGWNSSTFSADAVQKVESGKCIGL